MASSSNGPMLAQQIYDEFLVCKICLDAYKTPKSLTCLHTFCENCIENHIESESTYKKYSDYREFTCPLCRKRTQLPVGGVRKLPDNFLVSSLLVTVGHQRQRTSLLTSQPCDICKTLGRKHKEAVYKCLDCNKLLCIDCTQAHRDTKVTSGHSLFGVQIEKDVQCKDHADEAVRFYCVACDACICILCTFNQHVDHQIVQFADAVNECRSTVKDLLATCRDKLTGLDSQLDTLGRCQEVIVTAQQKIRDAAVEYIREIRNNEQTLLDELHAIYGANITSRIATKKDLITMIESMKATCAITDIVLAGKDIELLLLKKDVEEKLTSLNAVDVPDLPKESSKRVEFVSGAVDFGYICDRDKPLSSTMRLKKSGAESKPYKMGNEVKEMMSQGQTSNTNQTKESHFQMDQPKNNAIVKTLENLIEKGTMTDCVQEKGVNATSERLPPTISANVRVSPPKQQQQQQANINEQEPIRRRRNVTVSTSSNNIVYKKQ